MYYQNPEKTTKISISVHGMYKMMDELKLTSAETGSSSHKEERFCLSGYRNQIILA
jgi:hypothetical protein